MDGFADGSLEEEADGPMEPFPLPFLPLVFFPPLVLPLPFFPLPPVVPLPLLAVGLAVGLPAGLEGGLPRAISAPHSPPLNKEAVRQEAPLFRTGGLGELSRHHFGEAGNSYYTSETYFHVAILWKK